MHDSILKHVDLSYFDRLFSKLAGIDFEFAVCNHECFPVWTSNKRKNGEISKALNHFRDNNGHYKLTDQEEFGRITVTDRRTLYYSPISRADDNHTGWVLALGKSSATDQQDSSHKNIIEALKDIATSIEREFRLHQELDSLTQELAERYEELNLVYKLSRSLDPSEPSDGIFEHFLQLAVNHLTVDVGIFVDAESKSPICTVGLPDSISGVDFIANQVRGNLFHFVCAVQGDVIVNDIEDPRRSYLCPHLPYKILAEPVIFEKKVKGAILLLRQNSGPDFSNSDRKLAQVMAEQVGILMRNRDMYKAMHLFTEQMAAALIEAVDAKDPYTRGHSDRVTQNAVKIGKYLELPPSELKPLYWAALLHDVGKIGVPDAVLSKPDRLSRDERILIRVHPERGYNILQYVDHLHSSLPGVRYHHENFDGTGYPQGLDSKAIPLQARIIAVADSYDAMTSSRAYRSALSHEQAMIELKRTAGTQLDPDIVQVWVKLMRKKSDSHQEKHPPEEEWRNG